MSKLEGDGDLDLKEGSELDVEINELGRKGDGIVTRGDYKVIIPGVKLYNRFRVKIVKLKGNSAFAEVVRKLDEEKTEEDEKDSF